MPRAKQRTEAMRDHVLQVAIARLEAEGAAAFTARRIARDAATSMPAIYELFGDKGGLIRAVFFEGFRLLRARLGELEEEADPRQGIVRVLEVIRAFVRAHPTLAGVMFSRPFTDFDPGPSERDAGSAVREFIVGRVRRCIEAGVVAGDAADAAHVLLAVVQGLAVQEDAGWLGSSEASVNRRWRLAIDAVLAGLGQVEPPSTRAPRRATKRRRAF